MALLASTLPAGTKYATPQELLNLFAQNLSIPASDSTLFILSATAPTDVSKVWIDTSGASPVLKVYLNGAWTSISVSSVFSNGLTVTGADVNLLGNSVFVSNTNQRVGIGTNSPTQKLDVDGTVRCQNLQLTAGGTLAADIVTVGALITATGSTGAVTLTGTGSVTTPTLTVNTNLTLPNNSVTTSFLNNLAVTSAKLADDNVTSAKLAPSIRTTLNKADNIRPGATVPLTGKVKGVAIVNAGNGGYSSAPTISIAAPPAGGTTATAVATVAGGFITSITVVEEGSGYIDENPTVTISGGGGANAKAVAYACVYPFPLEDGKTGSCTGNSFYAITSHNTIKVNGYNGYGELATGAKVDLLSPRDIFLWDSYYEINNLPQPVPVRLHTTGATLYVIGSDGSLWSSGLNDAGQLGKGYTGDQDANDYLTRITFSGGGVVKKFACNWWGASGLTTALALVESSTGNTLYGWGRNDQGQLGTGGTADANTPTPLTTVISGADNYDTIVDFMIAGRRNYSATFVLFSSGKVRASGYNGQANLSNGDVNATNTFGYVKLNSGTDLTGVKEIAAAAGYTSQVYFRTDAGRIYASGYNNIGALGNGNANNTTTYVVQNSLGAIWPTGPGKFIYASGAGGATGPAVVWAFAADGNLYRWGYNGYGQLGTGNDTSLNTPVQLAGYNTSNVSKLLPLITEGNTGGIAILKTDNSVWVAGYNGYGNLGIGNETSSITTLNTVRFPKSRVKDILWVGKSSDQYGLGILATDGNLYFAGNNYYRMMCRGESTHVTAVPTSANL